MAGEELLHAEQPGLGDVHTSTVVEQESTSKAATEQVPADVSAKRTDPRQPEQSEYVDVALSRDHATRDDDGFTANELADDAPVSRNAITATSAYVYGPSVVPTLPISSSSSGG